VVVADLPPARVVTPERRARALLAVGAVLGLATAAATLVRGAEHVLAPDVVALVNGAPIRRDDYLRALAAVATDRRAPLDEAQKRRVLDRLVDEELLLQRGMALGLARNDRTLRAQLVAATMALLAEVPADAASEAELRDFYASHRDYFLEPGRIRVRQVLVRTDGRSEDAARARAELAARRLRAGEPFATVRGELGDEETAPIPDALLPAAKLREYVGETAMRTALAHEPGQATEPVRSSQGFHVLQVAERSAPAVPAFEEIVERVRLEQRRRADEARLRAALTALRGTARVRTIDALP
jgi:parvulin-like peptidyl-prolyl isomerase